MHEQRKSIGLMADGGFSRQATDAAARDLENDLSGYVDEIGNCEVSVSYETLPLTSDGQIPVMDQAEDLRSRHGWDYIVYLTDLPRYQDGDPLLCKVSATNQAALVPLPTAGALRLRVKIRKLMVALVRSVYEGPGHFQLEHNVQAIAGFKAARRIAGSGQHDTEFVVVPGWWSRVRLLSGMVRSNRPGRMLPALSISITAAVATGAFGVYYGSIWTLADALPLPRLLMAGILVVAALSFWLIFRNGLWNTRHHQTSLSRGLDNATTIIMVATSVILMYLLVATILFCIGLFVIEAGYLESELQHPVTMLDYFNLAWLAASLGTLAGALGSNFDSDDKIRAATYSKAEHERRQRTDSYND